MKKSKFLKSSKDMMLSRSFNPAKCKTSLRLAGSRLKLLKNKKDVQVKQMRREIAQLLESGQDRTARIRVEHVIREEKMMAAYDLIEIYCELIVARLPIIESQKNCPIDLKEAITSVIFASLRCGDVPELLDVRKHFTAKYGKDFTTAAIELRPECGVGRMLVEKLSAVAPDGQTKIKILSAIAEEHNVKWDQKSFEEKDSLPPSDLLSGPSTFGRESQPAPGIQPPQSNNNSHDSSYFYQHDHKNSLGTEKLTSAQTSNVSTTFQPEANSPGGDRAQFLYQGGGQKRWNMEFKDATSAAQAAAESAEMASMAARAAAELSSGSRITRQYSTESHNSHASYISKDEGPEMYVNSKLTSKQFPEESANSSSSEIDEVKPNRVQTSGSRGKKEYNQSASVKSKSKGETGMKKKSFKYTAEEKPENFTKQSGRQHSANSSRSGSIISDDVNIYSNSEDRKVVYDVGEDPFMHEEGIRGEADQPSSHVPVFDGYSRKNSLKEVSKDEMSMKKRSFKYKAEEKPENFIKQKSGKQHSANSSLSDSSISDDVNIYSNQKGVYDVGEDPFMHKEGIHGQAAQPSSHGAPVVFDNYDSDSQLHEFDVGPTYDDHEPEFHWPSSGQKSPEHLSVNTDSWSPRSSSSKIVKSSPSPFVTTDNSSFDSAEKLAIDGLEKDVSMPVIFDDSDGPSSESEEELKMSRRTPADRSTNLGGKSVGSKFKGKAGASDGSRLNEKHSSGFNKKQSSLSSDDDLMPDRESGDGLVYQKLTGGLRHKGYNQPPYSKNQLNTSVQKATVENTAAITSSTLENKKSVKKIDHYSESDSDSSEEEESLQKSSGRKQELYTPRAGKEVKIKPSLRATNSVFDSDNSDLDDNPPKESFARKSHLQAGISRRTKASPSTGKTSYTKTQLKSESIDFDDISETPKYVESPRKSNKLETDEQTSSAKVASRPTKSNYWGPSEPYNSAVAKSESKIRARHDSHDSDVSVGRKPTNSSKFGNSESKEASNSTNSISQVETQSSPTGKISYSKKQLRSESIDFDDISETPKKVESPRKSSNYEQPNSAKVASKPVKSNYWGPPEPYNSAFANSEPKIHARHDSHDSNVSMGTKPSSSSRLGNSESKVDSNSRVDKPSRLEPKTEAAALKKTNNSNKDDKKASHVHPKLPDYDSLVQTLRMNRS